MIDLNRKVEIRVLYGGVGILWNGSAAAGGRVRDALWEGDL